jgi:tetratricopeptide (TPR) repeat protein
MRVVSTPPSSWPSGFLRPEPSRFFGRGVELDRLDVSSPGRTARLATIIGPAGIGKTRLALRYATTRKSHFGGVWFCDMRDARTAAEMAYVALRALVEGNPASVGVDADAAVVRALVARPGALVVLDNVEHLLPDGAAVVKRWLAAAREMRIVVTSRIALGIPGERVVELAGVARHHAVELFIERVRERMPFAPGDDELAGIGEIVRRLDGVPLAIELAAARVGNEDAKAWLERVGDGTPASAAFALLEPDERDTLARCAVFRGGFSLQAAVALAGPRASTLVIELAAKSLLRVDRYQPMRFSMCEGMRALAGATLSPAEALRTSSAHARFFGERARAIADAEAGEEPNDAAHDWEDLHAAAAFETASGQANVVLQIALAIDVLAHGGGLGVTQLGHLDEALRRGAAGDLGLLGRALLVRSKALYALSRLVEARRDAETALSLAREIDDGETAGSAHRAAALAAFQLGELDVARDHLTRALAFARAHGEPGAIAAVHCTIGSLHNSIGELDEARGAFERALKLARGCGDGACEVLAMMGLGWNHFESGDTDTAAAHYEGALAIAGRLKMARSERIVVGYLGLLHFSARELVTAEDHLRRAALASRRAGDLRVEGIFEGIRAAVLASEDRVAEARAAFDLSDELLAQSSFYQRAVAIHRGHLDLAEARAASSEGHTQAAEAHVARASWRIEEARTHARRSDDARAAIGILERAIGQQS